MSTERSLIPSSESDVRERAAKLASADAHNMDEKCREASLLKGAAASSALDAPKKDCKGGKPVNYRGTLTRPLAYFGTFQLKPETEKLPWISDNTSGTVHPDMCTISMLFNEDLTLPKTAEQFIKQSLVLKEEARWERVKAVFYSFYPHDLKPRVFGVLSEMLRRDASRVIAKKTLRFENEIVLKMLPKATDPCVESDSESESDGNYEGGECSEEDAAKLNKQLSKLARSYERDVALARMGLNTATKKLHTHNSFWTKEKRFTWDVIRNPKVWEKELKEYEDATLKCVEARMFFHHLDNAVARYEPRTGWIHVKTQLLHPQLVENKTLPKEIFGIKLYREYRIKGSLEERNTAAAKQMALFEGRLRWLSKDFFNTLDAYHNDFLWYEYDVRIAYHIDPAQCWLTMQILGFEKHSLVVLSKPQILPYEKLHHKLKVYSQRRHLEVTKGSKGYDATVEYKDPYSFCSNCFSKDHLRTTCKQLLYAFACPDNAKNGK